MPNESHARSSGISKKAPESPHQDKWVFCYQPNVLATVKIVGETTNYWIVDHPVARVLKSACSSVPTTKAKAVKRGRNEDEPNSQETVVESPSVR